MANTANWYKGNIGIRNTWRLYMITATGHSATTYGMPSAKYRVGIHDHGERLIDYFSFDFVSFLVENIIIQPS